VGVADFGRTYEFALRAGVKWHDGRDFTSADVKFSFEQALLGNPGQSRTKASVGSALAGIDTPNALKVVFRFKDPYSPLLQQLNVTEAPIVRDSTATQQPVGTGPFKFVSKSSTDIRMDRNPAYFRPGLPCFAGMVESFVPDQGTQVALLEKGEVDWLGDVPGQDQGRLGGNRSVTLTRAPRGPGGANCITTLGFNLTAKGDKRGQIGGTPDAHPILSDLNVRKAIAFAIDRPRLLSDIQFGVGRVAQAPISSEIAYAHAPQPGMPGFDPGVANGLLDGAGWTGRDGDGTRTRGGQRLQIDFTSFATGTQPIFGEALEAQLKTVGIKLDRRPLANYEQTTFVNRDFDTTIVSYCNGDDPVVGVRRQYHSDQVSISGFTNAAGYKNLQRDTLWNNAQREPNQAVRAGFYRDIQSLAVRDLPYFWLVETVGTRGFRSDCSGFNVANTGLFAEAAFCRR
jgi:peptide/nickel transport system substrate-binding protein